MIQKAIAIYEDERLKNLDLSSTAIAIVGQAMCAIAGTKTPIPVTHFNPYALHRKRIAAKEAIDEQTAQDFIACYETGKLPAWVTDLVDLEMWELASQ